KMGFSENQVKVIKNYEAKGGKFYTKKDVAKIYSISDEEYARIEPYIRIKPDNRPRRNAYKKHGADRKGQSGKDEQKRWVKKSAPAQRVPENVVIARIDINAADTSDLKTLKGIGSVLAKRIVNYREALG